MFSSSVSQPVREEAGFDGVRQQIESPMNVPRPMTPLRVGGGVGGADPESLMRAADRFQMTATSREYAPGASYPAQSRPAELRREENPKNLKDFAMVGRNIGIHTAPDAVGGYVGAAPGARVELTENLTQRSIDDLANEYFNPTGPFRFERGNNSVYNQFYQHRMEHRGPGYKDAPGRFSGAFQYEIKRPGHAQEELWRSGTKGFKQRYTSKNDVSMINRQRADEAPDRGGLRMQYVDNYAGGWEKLINPRRVQHTVLNDVDPNLLLAYNANPYTQPLGIVPPRD